MPNQPKHGGSRPGAGRPSTGATQHRVSLPPWAVTLLKSLGNGSISKGIVAVLEKLRID